MSQLTIKDLSFYHNNLLDTQSLEGSNGNSPFPFSIQLEDLNISIDVEVFGLVFSEFPNIAGTAFIALAAVSAGQGASTYLNWNIQLSSNG